MIDRDRVSAVHTLYRQGVSRKAIARQLHLNVKTVRAILSSEGTVREYKCRDDRIVVDDALLDQLYAYCNGYIQRMHELLTEEHGIDIGYSTLTRLVRAKKHTDERTKRSCRYPDMPGEEMQHDTSVHTVRINGVKQRFISSGIYLRYSKMRYVRFYRRFNRFVMKCFIDEALRHWGYCARHCIIDNTNLAVFTGSGSSAIINPEMASFANNYGFTWKAHAIGHANRKAGTERNFYTIETNFLPGRTFRTLEDLNRQAVQWATVRYAKRPLAKTKLIPSELFEVEKSRLIKLPEFINTPYLPHRRLVDQYGYCCFDGNYYWIPHTVASRTVAVLQYASHLRIMEGTHEVQRYELPADGVKNELIVPPGHSSVNRRSVPKNRRLGCDQEEQRLREVDQTVRDYLDMVKKDGIKQYPSFVRRLYSLFKLLGPSLLIDTLLRALNYRVNEFAALERIAHQIIRTDTPQSLTTTPDTNPADYRSRPAYREGQFSRENDIDYDRLLEENGTENES